MAYRFTNTDKWNDAWFVSLHPNEKLLFNFLCDNCDIAGFIEIIPAIWAAQTGLKLSEINGALKGLSRGLIYSSDNSCLYLRTFLKHQKNLPLNENNKAHLGIIRRFEIYYQRFDIKDITDFIQAPSKPLQRGTGIGNGIGNGNLEEEEEKNWKNSFEIYLSECKAAFDDYLNDAELIKTQERLNPNVNVKLSIEKGFVNYWGTDAGWKHKKRSRVKEIDWKATFTNAIDMNKVYKQKSDDVPTSGWRAAV